MMHAGDVKLGRISGAAKKESDTIRLSLPTDLSRGLLDQGFTRAQVFISDEGILLKPYKGERRSFRALPIPEAWNHDA